MNQSSKLTWTKDVKKDDEELNDTCYPSRQTASSKRHQPRLHESLRGWNEGVMNIHLFDNHGLLSPHTPTPTHPLFFKPTLHLMMLLLFVPRRDPIHSQAGETKDGTLSPRRCTFHFCQIDSKQIWLWWRNTLQLNESSAQVWVEVCRTFISLQNNISLLCDCDSICTCITL